MTQITSPVTVYVVWHTDCSISRELAESLFRWFKLDQDVGDSTAGIPIYFRSLIKESALHPSIELDAAELNVLVWLIGAKLVVDDKWRRALLDFESQLRNEKRALLLPVALDASFYRMGSLSSNYNPIRTLHVSENLKSAQLRRDVTGAITRELRKRQQEDDSDLPILDVFLSHAKRDGQDIAETLRDSVQQFGQLKAWYDANDLAIGRAWQGPMRQAAERGTAAMVAVVTDTYPTRPWCRAEALLARTPRRINAQVWGMQPVVAVQRLGARNAGGHMDWSRGVAMLSGVPRLGWPSSVDATNAAIGLIVDRLVLESLLAYTHQRLATLLSETFPNPEIWYVTWVPDPWSIYQLLLDTEERPRVIAYPGYSLNLAVREEMQTVMGNTVLRSYEEVWNDAERGGKA